MSKIHRATPDLVHGNITIRAPMPWISELDHWINSQPVPPKRTEVIRLAVTQFIDRQTAEKAASRKR